MRFYRGLQPFKVMSFDLDDTLYDNSDVIRLAEEHFLQCVQEHAQLSDLTSEYWREWKWQLAEKDPLIAEDVIATRIGFEHFQLSLRGGEQGRAKPHQDLFHQTAHYFGVKPSEILHIGDNLTTDVQGAIQAGCQAVWINLSGKDLNSFTEASVLPTLEINHLTELLTL